MESVDIRVLRTARDWLDDGHQLLLATVVRTWGSSPRPIGSMMALRDDGCIIGSVSGGCIEDDLIHHYTKAADNHVGIFCSTKLVKYGLTAEEAYRFGLPCGGTLELLLEFQPRFLHLDSLVRQLEAGQLIQRVVNCSTGEWLLKNEFTPDTLYFNGSELHHTIGPQYRMLIIGAGILAEYVATIALLNEFSVTVCDPRTDYLDTWKIPGVRLLKDMPDDAVRSFSPDQRTCIVALSHDPKVDDMALLEALNSKAFYVGAIGSRLNSARRRQRFIEHFDETLEKLNRLHAPIGIKINSKTPAEISVSVMAEILAVKNGMIFTTANTTAI